MTLTQETSSADDSSSDIEAAKFLSSVYATLQEELGKVIVGQRLVIEEMQDEELRLLSERRAGLDFRSQHFAGGDSRNPQHPRYKRRLRSFAATGRPEQENHQEPSQGIV